MSRNLSSNTIKKTGTKNEVFSGKAEKTVGGLKKDNLMKQEKTGKIISVKAHKAGLANAQNLGAYLHPKGKPAPKRSLSKSDVMAAFKGMTMDMPKEKSAPKRTVSKADVMAALRGVTNDVRARNQARKLQASMKK